MSGYFRFFLAYLVLLSHLGVRIFGLNPGVFAVTIFYILAGHVIARLFCKNFCGKRHSILKFYLERVLRIYPLYFFVFILTCFFLKMTHYGHPEFKLLNLLANLLIVPLNYYMYLENSLILLTGTEPRWWLIPPAWSLGAELQVYFLLPLLLKYLIVIPFFFLSSICIYTIANFGFIDSDIFGYRLVPGVLFIFMFGAFLDRIARGDAVKGEKILLFFGYCFCFFLLWYFVFSGYSWGAYTRETLLGILIGVPLVYFLIKFKKNLPLSKFMGSLSYGIFLSHFLAKWMLAYLGFSGNSIVVIIMVTGLSLFIALIGVLLIDKKIESIRYRISS